MLEHISQSIQCPSVLMMKVFGYQMFLLSFIVMLLIRPSQQLQSSQAFTLLRLQQLLNYPAVLSSWNSSNMDFCNSEPNASVTVVCYEDNISQLHIIGYKGTPRVAGNFSMDSFVTTLVKLPNLKVLTLVSLGLWGSLPGKIARLASLEILNVTSNFLYGALPQELSSLTSLRVLVLDDNMLSGGMQDWFGSLSGLRILSLRNNHFNGSLPDAFSHLENLRVLVLSHNHFVGAVPGFRSTTNLQVLDLEDNAFGPQFPHLGFKLVTLVLRKNKFRSAIPSELSNNFQLRRLDLSFNNLIGPFPPALISLPSITYLSIAENRLNCMLFKNTSCNPALEFVDLSSNLLTGHLPDCLLKSSNARVSLYAHNCLSTKNQDQQPLAFCQNEAIAVGIIPKQENPKWSSKVVIALGVTGGITGGVVLVGLIFLLARKLHDKKVKRKYPPTRWISEKVSTGYTSKFLSDARYITQTMKLGALGLPAYRTFSLEELEEATDNFDTSCFIGEGSQGQMYRGQLRDGSIVAVRCLKMKKRQSMQNFMHHIELISKLRHRHLVSALGHCFECYLDDSSVSRIFLIFEYVPNGNLRNWISEERGTKSLSWTQRIAAAAGVAKGIQFLHTGIVPGVYSNGLKITDILLDHNLAAKISSYNLPLLAESAGKDLRGTTLVANEPSCSSRNEYEDRVDAYGFGVILLEIISGKLLKFKNELLGLRDQLQASIAGDDPDRRMLVDPKVKHTCSEQALKTVVEICVRCLLDEPAERPSIEDVLWNLQFAAQVEEVNGESQSSEGSPAQPPQLQITLA